MTTFGDKIRKLRKEKKMTQQKLGDMVGVSHRTIRSWEVEGRYPKQSSLYQKLADAFQCQVSYLMNDNETVCLGNDEPSEYAGAKQEINHPKPSKQNIKKTESKIKDRPYP